MDPHKMLAILAGSDRDKINEAYRRLAKLTHPDKGGSAGLFLRRMLTMSWQDLLSSHRRSSKPKAEEK